MKVALTCIAKNEDYYLQEWIDYNLKLGFDHIFIYENNWKCNVESPHITKIPFPGESKQLDAYNHFITTNKNNFNYVAFFDCDEFLVLKNHKTIQEFLTDYGHPYGVGINWQMYGSDKLKRETNSLIKQFTKRQKDINKHVKTILNLSNNFIIMANPHSPNTILMDTNRKMFTGPFNTQGSDDIAILNHYYLKTFEDWELRCKRGRADCNLVIPVDLWNKSNKLDLDVEDLTALNFMYPNN